MKISVVGLGFVGYSMYKSFILKGMIENENIFGFDKYKDGGIGTLEKCCESDIMFLALPTKFNNKLGQYDKSHIISTCDELAKRNYQGVIVIKSTVEPETTNNLQDKYPILTFIHNPEFLTARTAFDDFHNQKHIVLGKSKTCSDSKLQLVKDFYVKMYPDAEISLCSSLESESMKIFCNCFYSVKVQFFTELYLLCKSNGCDYNHVKEMMLKNGWINLMHTIIPGPDGDISYGGLCFPKDTNALMKYMDKMQTPSKVLTATVEERNIMRKDHDNCE